MLTGHGRSDDPPTGATQALGGTPALQWPTVAALAAQGVTLVAYMGVATAPMLQAGLLTGLPPSTPVAVVQHATLPQQRHAVCRLDALAATIAREQLASPAIIVVGDVVRAAAHLRDVASACDARSRVAA